MTNWILAAFFALSWVAWLVINYRIGKDLQGVREELRRFNDREEVEE